MNNSIKLLKEEVVNKLINTGISKMVLISSVSNNLEYYHNILIQENFNYESKYVNLSSYSPEDLVGVNIEILEFLNNKNKGILFLDINLALKVFFDEVKEMLFEKDNEYERGEIVEYLLNNGYKKEYIVLNKGEFAIRGDIIDIFPSNLDNPIRLDFFDTLIENIKTFSTYDQRSKENLEKISIYGNVLSGIEREIVDMLDVFSKSNIEVFLENKELLELKLEQMKLIDKDNSSTLQKRFDNLLKKGSLLEVSRSKDRNYQDEIRIKKERIEKKGLKYNSVNQILEEDYVIHVEFGIGIYKGTVNINDRDYLYVQYADNDKLYIPVEKLDRISKYVSSVTAPKLYSLGTKGYRRREKRIREDVEKFAQELVNLQAKRKMVTKLPFVKDSVWQEEFEEKFPFNLTWDQQKAVDDIKHDLESGRLMDRLLVGDVGYGKTEVAMRAAFKAIENGYQCAILAPTTVLANQHFERCHNRFEEFGINVANLSRLTGKNTGDVLEGLRDGKIDLVIGTHRLLGDDVKFKNLGLLIIDEEQKFGVSAKEKIKKKREDIHLLTLSATPIPRTLNLALLGIRDISLIQSSPMDRLPIITERIEENDIKKVMLKELARDGQVFYITNNVKGMMEKKKDLKKLMPDFVNIEYIHGQLSPKEIKNKINDFDEGKFDILIASTIVENGIDITNANSIIIEKYTSLGLSQIYQLRGRVGRGKRQGYCYLLDSEYKTKKGKEKDKSLEKIEGVEGGGYILSLEDLNIRGAGEILGEKQHGAIDMFGYDLYLKMLKNEINRLKGEKVKELKNTEINLLNNGYIPKDYIEKDERIVIYKRYAEVQNLKELEELNEEIRDRFGKLPKEMQKFIYSIKIKIYMLENGIDKVEETMEEYILTLPNYVVKLTKKEFSKRIN
ncbi:DEAD/DEAH box helicase [Streptobacillus felis]|uniref:Transcription-repair-coupling factor n=2 Tax=Streptobacillus TaxID=34104 RepID=A0A7Z0PG95_9FUSO|nr:DEAD/DEAH box helicase [Streptobacillus felis]NYV27520.1 DEAD/DEAH box helicase [Streptobacillus felis]